MKPSIVKNAPVALLAVALSACPQPAKPPELPLPATIKSFTASSAAVAPGEAVTLSWEVESATSISLDELSGGPVAIDSAATGSVQVTVNRDSAYRLTARSEVGSDSRLLAIAASDEKDRAVLLISSPTEVPAGESVSLAWSAPGAETVSITEVGGAALDLKGQKVFGSLSLSPARSTSYELSADGRKANASVVVRPVVVSFEASPRAAQPGQPLALSWKTAGGEKLILSRDGAGALTTVTDPAAVADGTYSDTLPATLPENGLVRYELSVEAGATVARANLTVYVGVDPAFISYQIPPHAQAGEVFVVSWETAAADGLSIAVGGQVVYQALEAATVASGHAVLPSPASTTTVELRASNARGGETKVQQSVEPVGEPVVVRFEADKQPGIALGGEAVTLSWNVTNLRSVRLVEKDRRVLLTSSGQQAETGTLVVYPNADTVYVLSGDNGAGQAISPQLVTVTVGAPAKLSFSPEPVPDGANTQVTGHSIPGGGDVFGLPTVVKGAPGDTFIDIATTGMDTTVASDTAAKLVPLPEPFGTTIYGVPVSLDKISVSPNGWFMFRATVLSGPDTRTAGFGTALDALAIAPYWDDLTNSSTGHGKVLYQHDSLGSGQRLIVQWEELEHDTYPGSRLTFQAQVYSSGKIVFAYKKLEGLTANAPAAGVVNGDESSALQLPAAPEAGDVYTLFGTPAPLPFTLKATAQPYRAYVAMPDGALEVNASPELLPPDQFAITEVNFNPATGKGQWFEVRNATANPINLQGWDLDFGGGSVHTVASSLVLPPNGYLLLGQDADAAEASAGGPSVDYVYGSSFVMPTASGSVALSMSGGAYTTFSWTSAGTEGVSLQAGPSREDLTYASGVTSLFCPATASYGGSGQLGTPKASNTQCFPWFVSPAVPGGFQSILTSGTAITGMVSTTNNGIDSVYKTLDFTALGGRPVKIGDRLYGTAAAPLVVSSNGWISLKPQTSSNGTNGSIPATSNPNALLAIFWDDLAGNAGSSGVYWKQLDPDGTPESGDEYTLVSWENWKRYSSTTSGITSSLNFQVKFLEATGDVEYHFGLMTSSDGDAYAGGSSASTWLESDDGRAALAVNVNSTTNPGIQSNTGYRFAFVP